MDERRKIELNGMSNVEMRPQTTLNLGLINTGVRDIIKNNELPQKPF